MCLNWPQGALIDRGVIPKASLHMLLGKDTTTVDVRRIKTVLTSPDHAKECLEFNVGSSVLMAMLRACHRLGTPGHAVFKLLIDAVLESGANVMFKRATFADAPAPGGTHSGNVLALVS